MALPTFLMYLKIESDLRIMSSTHICSKIIDLTAEDCQMIDLTIESPEMDSDDPDLICCICLDNRANTIAEPCGHMCVCVQCSIKLANTRVAKICMRCTLPIEKIIDDLT